jgi:hypothetical protein
MSNKEINLDEEELFNKCSLQEALTDTELIANIANIIAPKKVTRFITCFK